MWRRAPLEARTNATEVVALVGFGRRLDPPFDALLECVPPLQNHPLKEPNLAQVGQVTVLVEALSEFFSLFRIEVWPRRG